MGLKAGQHVDYAKIMWCNMKRKREKQTAQAMASASSSDARWRQD
jgi:hypothetical protein